MSLAQDAARLAEHPVLSGWLHCTARNLSTNSIRANIRRTAREQEAAVMNELLAGGSNALWDSLAPHLDAALGELAIADRDALLLRYFERKSAREMAQILGTSEEAAQKRVSRAVERLREFFSKRGIAIGGAGLVVVISANAVQAAPTGLALAVSTSAFLTAAAVHTSTAITTTKVILMTTAQKTLLGLAVALTVAAPVVTHFHAESRLREQKAALMRGTEQLSRLHALNQDSPSPAASPSASAPQTEQLHEVLRLRGEITGLQSEIQELSDVKTNAPLTRAEKLASFQKYYSDRVQWLKDLFAANPSQQVPELKYLSDDKWLQLAEYDHHAMDPDNTHLMSSARSGAEIDFAMQNLMPALKKFLKVNQGRFPSEIGQLEPYLPVPEDALILQRWTILPMKSFPEGTGVKGDWAITQKAPVNAAFDGRFVFNANGGHIENSPAKAWGAADHQP